jgi:hypothetical protein
MEEGITKLWSEKNPWYRIECSCGLKQHACDISLEVDKELEIISAKFFVEFYACSYSDKWCERLWWRIKSSFKLLFLGYIDLEHYFLFKDENHIKSFISALNEGIKEIKSKNNMESKNV